MSPISKRWNSVPPITESQLSRLSNLHPLLVQILANRGITDRREADRFLNGWRRFDDPMQLLGMPDAVERIWRAIRQAEPIVVYGDFDADGVTSTVLLVQALQALGARVSHYIPDRVDEGYGLNCAALKKIASDGAALVITVDCGIRSPDEAAYGVELGLDMIITDHHSIARDAEGRECLPPALAVINPKRSGDPYSFSDLAGVGVAFKLAQALLIAEKKASTAGAPPALAEEDLLDLVALGTVADMAPLLGENRALVQRGLAELRMARRPGVRAMLDAAGLEPARVTASTIGFVLGPRINAAGRLSSAEHSYELLSTGDPAVARAKAEQLEQLNQTRQARTRELVEAAQLEIGGDDSDRADRANSPDRLLYLVAGPEYDPGIVGLVAGRLADDLYRPVLVAQLGPEETHGSARSIPEFDITAALDACRDLLIRHGGHAAAAGFTVATARLPELRERLEHLAQAQLGGRGEELAPAIAIDAWVELEDLDWAVQELLAQLEPCGYGNPEPVLASKNLRVESRRRVGADGAHLKLSVSSPAGSRWWDAIAFRLGDRFDDLPDVVDLAYTLEVNEFNGRRSLQLNVRDLRPAS